MRTTIDGAGRIVIPKKIRDEVGLTAGTRVEVNESDGVVQIKPTPGRVEIIETSDGPVLRRELQSEPLTALGVRELLESDRR